MSVVFNFEGYKNGTINVEVQGKNLERLINILCKNNVIITNVKRININLISFDTDLVNYEKLRNIIAKTNCKIKINKRSGFFFIKLKLKKRISMVLGSIIFVIIILYLSSFIWGIDIDTEKNIAPYEIRQELKQIGIKPGISKSGVNVYHIEENLCKNNENIVWAKVRIQGSKLKVSIVERQAPPLVKNENTPCNLIAKKPGVVVRVYTKAGTATVKNGDIVRKGQVIVSGEQGKEGTTYSVHASGSVIAKTYYEETREVPLNKVNRKYTGKKIENYYVVLFGKKIYIKNSLNKFTKYDKIVKDDGLIKKEIYSEVKEEKIVLNPKTVGDKTADAIYKNIIINFDKSVKIINRVVEKSMDNNNLRIRVLVISEEDIAEVEK